MIKLDLIVAVKDVKASAKWYQQVFGLENAHGGDNFAVLETESKEVVLCLHKWEQHYHPTLTDQSITVGNGVLLYFRTQNMPAVKKKLDEMGWNIEEDIHMNSNSLRNEFSIRDPDGYFLTITEFHDYNG